MDAKEFWGKIYGIDRSIEASQITIIELTNLLEKFAIESFKGLQYAQKLPEIKELRAANWILKNIDDYFLVNNYMLGPGCIVLMDKYIAYIRNYFTIQKSMEASIILKGLKFVYNKPIGSIIPTSEASPTLQVPVLYPEAEITIPEIEIKGAFAPEIAEAMTKFLDKYSPKPNS